MIETIIRLTSEALGAVEETSASNELPLDVEALVSRVEDIIELIVNCPLINEATITSSVRWIEETLEQDNPNPKHLGFDLRDLQKALSDYETNNQNKVKQPNNHPYLQTRRSQPGVQTATAPALVA